VTQAKLGSMTQANPIQAVWAELVPRRAEPRRAV
jgi:hypothetical protein